MSNEDKSENSSENYGESGEDIRLNYYSSPYFNYRFEKNELEV